MHFSNTDFTEILVKLEAILYFIVSIVYYFIPCILGSFINVVIANRGKKVRKRDYIKKAAFLALVPSVLILIIVECFGKNFEGKENLFLGGAFALGLCGDQITAYSVKLKGLAKLIIAFQRFKADTEIFTGEDFQDLGNTNTDISQIDEQKNRQEKTNETPDDANISDESECKNHET